MSVPEIRSNAQLLNLVLTVSVRYTKDCLHAVNDSVWVFDLVSPCAHWKWSYPTGHRYCYTILYLSARIYQLEIEAVISKSKGKLLYRRQWWWGRRVRPPTEFTEGWDTDPELSWGWLNNSSNIFLQYITAFPYMCIVSLFRNK